MVVTKCPRRGGTRPTSGHPTLAPWYIPSSHLLGDSGGGMRVGWSLLRRGPLDWGLFLLLHEEALLRLTGTVTEARLARHGAWRFDVGGARGRHIHTGRRRGALRVWVFNCRSGITGWFGRWHLCLDIGPTPSLQQHDDQGGGGGSGHGAAPHHCGCRQHDCGGGRILHRPCLAFPPDVAAVRMETISHCFTQPQTAAFRHAVADEASPGP